MQIKGCFTLECPDLIVQAAVLGACKSEANSIFCEDAVVTKSLAFKRCSARPLVRYVPRS